MFCTEILTLGHFLWQGLPLLLSGGCGCMAAAGAGCVRFWDALRGAEVGLLGAMSFRVQCLQYHFPHSLLAPGLSHSALPPSPLLPRPSPTSLATPGVRSSIPIPPLANPLALLLWPPALLRASERPVIVKVRLVGGWGQEGPPASPLPLPLQS